MHKISQTKFFQLLLVFFLLYSIESLDSDMTLMLRPQGPFPINKHRINLNSGDNLKVTISYLAWGSVKVTAIAPSGANNFATITEWQDFNYVST